MDHNEVDGLVNEYLNTRRLYEGFALAIERMLTTLFPDALTSHRAKGVDSLREKLTRPSKGYTTLAAVPDLAGVRLIFTTIDAAEKAVETCRGAFVVDDSQSRIMHATSDSFGYESVHLVVQITDDRASLIDWSIYRGLTIEIQVRTVVQHAWAEISHSLDYKNTYSVPISLRRQLNRVSALLEVADEEFSALTRAHNHLLLPATLSHAPTPGTTIDIVSVSQLLTATNPSMSSMVNDARTAGFLLANPEEQELDPEFIADLVSLCAVVGISDIQRLVDVSNIASDVRQTYFEAVRATTHKPWYVDASFALMLLVVLAYSRTIQGGDLVNVGFEQDIADRTLGAARRFDPPPGFDA